MGMCSPVCHQTPASRTSSYQTNKTALPIRPPNSENQQDSGARYGRRTANMMAAATPTAFLNLNQSRDDDPNLARFSGLLARGRGWGQKEQTICTGKEVGAKNQAFGIGCSPPEGFWSQTTMR